MDIIAPRKLKNNKPTRDSFWIRFLKKMSVELSNPEKIIARNIIIAIMLLKILNLTLDLKYCLAFTCCLDLPLMKGL